MDEFFLDNFGTASLVSQKRHEIKQGCPQVVQAKERRVQLNRGSGDTGKASKRFLTEVLYTCISSVLV